MRASLFALLATALTAACASSTAVDYHAVRPRQALIVAADGRAIGQAHFTEGPAGVMIRIEIAEPGLTPGWHGLHLHQRGDCSDFASGFQSAGGHIGMRQGVHHGLMDPEGPEAGDLANLFASPNPPYAAQFYSPYVTLADHMLGAREPLLDEDGSALIIHANADDQTTQPIGGAGPRVACAALRMLP
ncbi:superoxide dismutase family protein [Terricaulis sp.]|uniref:superoxide dismutase family protein n=1 Tax=Terricaulis sp. TaxID=2768686 RepID=UPI003782D658